MLKSYLYIKADEAFLKNWWTLKTVKVFTGNYNIKACHVIHGYTEIVQFWKLFIRKIIRDIGFKDTIYT